jgi:hypothetical protein
MPHAPPSAGSRSGHGVLAARSQALGLMTQPWARPVDMQQSPRNSIPEFEPRGRPLANKMANTINASARLRKTYTPVNVASVRWVDEARQRGRKAIKGAAQ